MTAGRWTKITGVETVPSPEIISGQIYCIVVYEIDLSQTNTPSEFNQGHFKTLTSTTAYPDITKEDLENGGTIYQFPFCQYVKNTSGISQFVDARAIFNIEEVWKAIAEQNLNYKEEFEAFFAEQKKEIDEIKEGLNETGNATVNSTGLVKPDGKTINVDDHGTISVDVLDSMEEVNANTDIGKPAGALAVKELSRDLQNITPHIGEVNKSATLPFTVPQSGFIRMSIQAKPNTTAYWYVRSRKNGDLYATITLPNTNGGTSPTLTSWFFVEQGDVLETQEISGTASQSIWFIPFSVK